MDPGRQVKSDPRRALPAVDRLAREILKAGEPSAPELPAWAATAAARQVLEEERERLSGGASAGAAAPSLLERARRLARQLAAPRPSRVVNATGIVLHTHLGRAPLAAGAAAAAAAAAAGYSDLELDLASGRRGDRLAGVARKLEILAEAPAAFVVNNNAAAVLLVLDTLARGCEAIVSRGELVEIGGSFRVPDIIERAGVRLVEVGTTNRTRLSDYESAIGPATRLLLKVHRSNFELRGFVGEVSLAELAELGRSRGLPVVEDLGSGSLVDLTQRGFPAEAYAPGRLRAGADLVLFSGDKLLGGPQAGVILGEKDLVERLRSNPLARALRLDKLGLAALDWTLRAHLEGRAERELPALRQLLAEPGHLEQRAAELARRLAGIAGGAASIAAVPDRSLAGGGSLPGFGLGTWVVEVGPRRGSAGQLCARLREAETPVLARVRDACVVLDVRTLLEGDEDLVEASFAEALSAAPRPPGPDGGGAR